MPTACKKAKSVVEPINLKPRFFNTWLNLSEIGQIAGRAGRYLNNGSFGITGDCKEINPEEVDLLENHKFEEIRTLFWRNSNLNFNTPYSLIKSLEEKPQKEWLRKIHECEDEKALKYFLRDKNLENISLCNYM